MKRVLFAVLVGILIAFPASAAQKITSPNHGVKINLPDADRWHLKVSGDEDTYFWAVFNDRKKFTNMYFKIALVNSREDTGSWYKRQRADSLKRYGGSYACRQGTATKNQDVKVPNGMVGAFYTASVRCGSLGAVVGYINATSDDGKYRVFIWFYPLSRMPSIHTRDVEAILNGITL